MSSIGHNGGPAFPYNFPPDNPFGGEGMSLRDWFAGQALAGMDVDGGSPETNARWAYRVADAMLAARKEPMT